MRDTLLYFRGRTWNRTKGIFPAVSTKESIVALNDQNTKLIFEKPELKKIA